jgi:hypothetical protein
VRWQLDPDILNEIMKSFENLIDALHDGFVESEIIEMVESAKQTFEDNLDSEHEV